MARSADRIDSELKKAVTRRYQCRERISALSAAVIADTRLIDLLLAERAEGASPQLTGDPGGR